jgi:pilus assembly protein CpaF
MTEEDKLLSALGPLAPLFADPHVIEILVDTPERILINRQGELGEELQDSGIRFATPEALYAVIEGILKFAGLELSPGQTVADARLTEQARMLVVLPPAAILSPCLVIRKLIVPTLSWEQLIEFSVLTPQALDLISSAVKARANILIAGGTGSGKTTVANLTAELIPATERLVVVEAAHELQIHHPRAIFLEAGPATGLSISDMLSTAAKMRPDWLIIGELLGAEAMHALEIINRGHSGITTIHATSVEDALARLEAMCLMANLGLGLAEIRALIASALQLITYQQKLSNGRRKIMQIVELRGLQNDRYVLQPLFRYNQERREFEPTGAKPGWEHG